MKWPAYPEFSVSELKKRIPRDHPQRVYYPDTDDCNKPWSKRWSYQTFATLNPQLSNKLVLDAKRARITEDAIGEYDDSIPTDVLELLSSFQTQTVQYI